jgi:hypothetical protein
MEKVVESLSLFRPFPLARRGRLARALTGTGRLVWTIYERGSQSQVHATNSWTSCVHPFG